MKRIGLFALAALAAAAPLAAQMYEKISVTNSTGYTISEIYVSPSQSDSWEEDVLDKDVLADGQEVEIDFGEAVEACQWDMKVVYADGDEAVWDGLDLCENWRFELFYNARSGATHLTASDE